MAIDITSSAAIDDASASDVYVAIFTSYKTRKREHELPGGAASESRVLRI